MHRAGSSAPLTYILTNSLEADDELEKKKKSVSFVGSASRGYVAESNTFPSSQTFRLSEGVRTMAVSLGSSVLFTLALHFPR